MGYTGGSFPTSNNDVAACIALYRRALQAVPVKHIRHLDDGGKEVVKDSEMIKSVRKPNNYLSQTELMGLIVDQLLSKGEFLLLSYSGELHPITSFTTMRSENGEVFYRIALNEAQKDLMSLEEQYIPQRYAIHGKYAVNPQNPLRALSPIEAYATSIGLGEALRSGQRAFHSNKAQPSGVLTTDATLTAEQALRIRERWNEMSQRMKQGETPILTNNLKFQQVSVSANESQVIQLLGFTTKDIAKAYGVPLALLGENAGVTYSNLEQLVMGWRTTGLLSTCMVIEQAFERSFYIEDNEELLIDVSDLARADALSQADTLTRLVQNGIMKPNEARARLELSDVSGVAAELVAQAQIQPLQLIADIKKEEHQSKMESEALQQETVQIQNQAQIAYLQNPAPEPAPTKSLEPETVKEPEEEPFDHELFNKMITNILK
jgi:HK97 family phage portal protein